MADLLKEFFERDLTDAEEKALADLIADSPEKSHRFARYAGKAYSKTGLPDPSGSGGSDLSEWGPVALKLGLILTVAGFMVYSLCRYSKALFCPAAVTTSAFSIPAPAKHTAIPRRVTAAAPSLESPDLYIKLTKQGMVQPTAFDPTKPYQGLDIIVEQKATGLVTVRALDRTRKEVRLLFAGLLKPGKWDFLWDGRTDKGQDALPGVYHMEVQNGKTILTKEILIQGAAVSSRR